MSEQDAGVIILVMWLIILIPIFIYLLFILVSYWEKEEKKRHQEKEENNLKEQALGKAKEFENTKINHRIEALNIANSILKFFHSINRESAIILFLNESNVCMHVDIYFGDI